MTPENTGILRDEKGRFPKGTSGNPAGKPVGAVSVIGKIKKKFEENPEYFNEWVDKLLEDASNRRAIMEQIDGKPAQPISNADGEPFVIQVMKYGNDTTPPPVST